MCVVFFREIEFGERYEGYIRFGMSRLEFAVVCSPNLEDYTDGTQIDPEAERIREALKIVITGNGGVIDLEPDEYALFFQLAVSRVLIWYYSSMYSYASMRGLTSRTIICSLPDEKTSRNILRRRKFGVVLPKNKPSRRA